MGDQPSEYSPVLWRHSDALQVDNRQTIAVCALFGPFMVVTMIYLEYGIFSSSPFC